MTDTSPEKAKGFQTRLLRVMRDFSAEILCITKEINDAVQETPEGEALTPLIKLHIFATVAEGYVDIGTNKIQAMFPIQQSEKPKPYLVATSK
jgi:hypothetical protein